jgi:hypothetical protein
MVHKLVHLVRVFNDGPKVSDGHFVFLFNAKLLMVHFVFLFNDGPKVADGPFCLGI